MSERMKIDFEEGDVVSVKNGIKDPDFGNDISGWRGRIDDIYDNGEGKLLVMIYWDSVTLNNMDISQLVECKQKEIEWDKMVLEVWEVELAEARDNEEDVSLTIKKIKKRLSEMK